MSQSSPQSPSHVPPIVGRLPVLYRSVTPMNREQHAAMRLAPLPQPLSFARGTHLLPAMVDEFAAAARELPIVFLPEADGISPVFMLSLRSGINGFVTSEGLWTASYLPAYIRRYPFVLGDIEGRDPILCFDDQFEGFNETHGEIMFNPDGKPSAVLEAAMQFAGGFREAGQRTTQFVKKLRELDLFKSVTMDVNSAKLGKTTIEGLLVIDEAKLKTLNDAVILDLQKTGYLPAIHAHLLSLGGIVALT